MNQTGSDWMKYIPLFLYSFRWNIETSYYEQKTFWSFCSYMVRSCKGIEMLIDLINISYCAMKLLPYQDKTFSGELVLLVLFLIRGRFVPRYRSMLSLVPEGVFIGGGESIYAFCKSRPSYLQIASIHSLVSGMDSCLSRSKVTMMDLQTHFTSLVFVSMTC